MEDKYKKELDVELESAVIFLVNHFTSTGHNPKPVIFHSIKVAMYLYDLNYSHNMIMAAFLHDLLEDTDVTLSQIEAKFGSDISRLVSALSFNSDIPTDKERYTELFERTKQAGREALIIKCADILQNSYFVGKSLKQGDYFVEKMRYFLDISQEHIGNETPWKDLNSRLRFIEENYIEI